MRKEGRINIYTSQETKAGTEYIDLYDYHLLIGALAACYKESGADPSGGMKGDKDEDWRLAERALLAVREARKDYEDSCRDYILVMEERDAAIARAEAAESELSDFEEEARHDRMDRNLSE